MQQTIFEKYRDEQAGLDAQINSIFEERTRVKGLQVLPLTCSEFPLLRAWWARALGLKFVSR